MSKTEQEQWIQNEHKYDWFKPISWDAFLEFIGGDASKPVWPGKGSDEDPSKNEPGKTSGRKWQEWWRFYWKWQSEINGENLPENLPDWAKPDKEPLSDEDIQYWMKHWKSFVSRHWHGWEKHNKPRPTKDSVSIEYNSIIAWGADPENPPPYV